MENSYFESLPLPKSLEGKIYFREGNQESNDKLSIENLSRINIFVGPNNSGKSLIARGLIKRAISFKSNSLQLQKNIEAEFGEIFEHYSSRLKNTDFEAKIGELRNPRSSFPANFLQNLPYRRGNDLILDLRQLKGDIKYVKLDENGDPIVTDEKLTEFEIVDEMIKQKSQLTVYNIINEKIIDKEKFKKIYIPTIRGLRKIYKDAQFKQTIAKNYDLSPDIDVKIEMGDDIHEEIFKMRIGKKDDRRKLDQFESFLGEVFFDGKEVDIVTQETVLSNKSEKVIIKQGTVEKEFFFGEKIIIKDDQKQNGENNDRVWQSHKKLCC